MEEEKEVQDGRSDNQQTTAERRKGKEKADPSPPRERVWVAVVLKELSDKWQVPVFIIGLVLIVVGFIQLIEYRVSYSTREYMELCKKAYESGEDEKAAKLATLLLTEYELDQKDKIELYSIIVRLLHKRQLELEERSPGMISKILSYLEKIKTERELDQEEVAILADVYEWSGDYGRAVGALEDFLGMVGDDRKPSIIKRIIKILPKTAIEHQFKYDEYIDRFLSLEGITDEDRVWAVDLKVERFYKNKRFKDAISLINDELGRLQDENLKLQLQYDLALGNYYEGRFDLAEPILRELLSKISESNEFEAKILLVLGNICLKDARPVEAIVFFNRIIKSYPLTEYHLAALVGKAEAFTTLHRFKDAVETYRECFHLLTKLNGGSLINRDAFMESLEKVSNSLHSEGLIDEAIVFSELELEFLDEMDSASKNRLYSRLAGWNEELAERLEKLIPNVEQQELIESLKEKIRNHYAKAGSYYLKLADSLSLLDNQGSATALWQSCLAYESAGEIDRQFELLKRFVHNWPRDKRIPLALFRLADLCYKMGRYELAEQYFVELIKEYTRTPWALKARVLLAETYIAMGTERYKDAENILLGIVDDLSNQQLFTPESKEFRDALFMLGKLYYYQDRYDTAISRLEEALERYKDAPQVPESQFIMAQCYRKLAEQVKQEMLNIDDSVMLAQLTGRWKVYLSYARDLYLLVIRSLGDRSDLTDPLKTYRKLAYVYYADCLFDLGDYPSAIKAYEATIDKFPRDTIALSCYVQILNIYNRLGYWNKSKAILERMKWLLNQLPESAFSESIFSRDEWLKWIEWNYKAGLLDYAQSSIFAQSSN